MNLRIGLIGVGLLLVLLMQPVRADIFILQNGGRIQGETVADENLEKTQLRIKTQSGGELILDRSQIKQVQIQSADEELYEAKRGNVADTVEAQWALAEWCRERNLIRNRTIHLERVVQLQPDHKAARSALGYQFKEGRWVRYEDIMQERGYVLYKGDWKLPQEIELIEQKQEQAKREKDWYQRLIKIRADYQSTVKAKQQEAFDTLNELNDRSAVPALLIEAGREKNPRLVELYLAALGRIGTTPALTFLVTIVFNEALPERTQEYALNQLKGGKHPEVVQIIALELKSKDNKRVNKAGEILGEIGDSSVIPNLIEALVTKHKFQISAGGNGQTSATFTPGGGGLGVGGKPQIIEQDLQNPKVLAALYKLIGQTPGFDYNIAAWRAWYDNNKQKPVISGRRD